jgi:hypothetical protein
MATFTQKNSLSIEEKYALFTEIENAKKNTGVRWKYGLANSTIQTIWKNRSKIISAFEQNYNINRKDEDTQDDRGTNFILRIQGTGIKPNPS